ncbi:MAG TPA: hypothetical protein DEQ20_06345 [Desulfobulbaceae bacterium]|nr:MAG: hypothetical protein A2520_02405 [Deltaproteobacteria bacterium RIFOXYD12_FULL_53_23]HCC54530.1 hypothetical protein [Desulfobulbaceae bacterium]
MLEVVLKILGLVSLVFTITLTWVKIPSFFKNSISNLKTELEILKLLDAKHVNYKDVKESVESKINSLYGQDEFDFGHILTAGSSVLIALGFGFGFGFWTYNLILSRSWWAIITGFHTLIVPFFVLASIGERPSSKQEKRGTN